MPDTIVITEQIDTLTITEPTPVTLQINEDPVQLIQLFDSGSANFEGIKDRFIHKGAHGESVLTVPNIGIAKDLFIYQGIYILSEYTGGSTVPPLQFSRSGNTLTLGTPLTGGERVLIKSSTALT